ncbi:hypothetical protein HID58_012144 [Brassica napus]|uniref:Cytochrome P450 n=1 Tax=Brassica napus TaxID=3708 RepID=A0ABQ8E075_BRANA|nr:hypothetical protein HID58_012144 [Brassica napus]
MEMAKSSTQLGATESLRRLFGENSDFLQRKEIHKYVRNLTSRFVGPENLKTNLIQDIYVLSRNYFEMDDKAISSSFDIKEAATKMVVDLIVKKVIGEMESEAVRELGLCWTAFRTNWFSFSYSVLGTTVYRFVKMVRLWTLIEPSILSQETTPGILAATVKLVADHPDVMEELKREHDAVIENQGDNQAGLTWEEYKSMTFTHMVIKETLRFTSAQPTVHRIPTEDAQVGGYTVPAGWLFFGIPLVHFDEEKYEDPLKFNPWRWKGKDLHGTLSKDYIPFGAGATLCVGSEFAKCIIAVFLHHLSRFRWSLDPKTRVLRRYMLMFPAGCRVEIAKELSDQITLVVVKLCHWIYKWRNPTSNGKLPPGSMGFPIIGETLEFMKPHDAFQLPTFLTKKILRHGPVFRTSLFGARVIISTDIGLNMEIAKTNHVPGAPKSLARFFGENNLFVKSKESHKHVRNLTSQFLGSQGLRLRMIQDIDSLARTHMELGAKNGGLDIKETSSKILIECLAKKVMGDMEPHAAKELTQCWGGFPRGWFRFSWSIPGNGVYRMLKARNQMMNLLKETVLKKRASGEELGEFFKIIFGETEGGSKKMSIENAIEYIFTFFVIANETTPGVLAATVKLINDNPRVKQELQREHKRIFQDKTEKDEADLTWEDYKSMTFTQMVINESLRITSTVPTMLRIVEHETHVGDYTIPAGWIFMGFPSVHFNPEKYEDPLAFNPWRWEGKDLGVILSRTYMPFGAGSRLCLGAEFAKMQMAIFIHHLCRYTWSMKTETKVLRRFILMFPRGSDVQISEDTEVDNSAVY